MRNRPEGRIRRLAVLVAIFSWSAAARAQQCDTSADCAAFGHKYNNQGEPMGDIVPDRPDCCAGVCVNLQSDRKNCRTCGHPCPPDKPICQLGTCAAYEPPPRCAAPYREVNGECVLVCEPPCAAGDACVLNGDRAACCAPEASAATPGSGRLFRCGGTCCEAGSTCCDGNCCAADQRCCGSSCCPSDNSCCGTACQAPDAQCCPGGYACSKNLQCCHGSCCDKTSLCLPEETGGTHCCPPENFCEDTCCVGDRACAPDGRCRPSCNTPCPPNHVCCESREEARGLGQLCRPIAELCNGECCPRQQRCGTDSHHPSQRLCCYEQYKWCDGVCCGEDERCESGKCVPMQRDCEPRCDPQRESCCANFVCCECCMDEGYACGRWQFVALPGGQPGKTCVPKNAPPGPPWLDPNGCARLERSRRTYQGIIGEQCTGWLHVCEQTFDIFCPYNGRTVAFSEPGPVVCCERLADGMRTHQPCDPAVDADCDGAPNITDTDPLTASGGAPDAAPR